MIKLTHILNEAENPCWKGYKQVGMKTKNGKEVPNCVPESVEVNEAHYTAVANLGTTKAKENLDSFDELQKFMDKMKSRKAISVQVTKINNGKKQTIDYDWDGRNWVSKNKKGVQESNLKGQLAGDSVQDIIKSIGSRFVSGEIKNTKRDGKTYIKLTDEKFGSGVVKILKSRFGIDAKVDYYGGKGTIVSTPSVSFWSDTILESKQLKETMIRRAVDLAQEILPKDVWSRYASNGPKNKEFVKSIVRDLTNMLNRFYKSYDVNVRIKEDILHEIVNKPQNEDLRKWLGSGPTGGWDRYDTQGNKLGKCGDAKDGEPYAACLSNEKAAKLGKDGRAAFVKRKRAAQKKSGDAKKGGEQKKGQKPTFVKTGA